jgi:hypothetical protein
VREMRRAYRIRVKRQSGITRRRSENNIELDVRLIDVKLDWLL